MTCEEYQWSDLPRVRKVQFKTSRIRNVTALAYYFRTFDRLDADFYRTEHAFLKTYETQGLLPSVIVLNQSTPAIESFCMRYGIAIQLADHLVPGKIETMALDMVANLHQRFNTDYVLIIQDDGFPVRPGLEAFVGKYDYIGAPWVKHSTYYDVYPAKYRVGNGGFSLRSKRLCETASCYYNRYFSWLPYWWYLLGDDTFYCKTLRFWFPRIRRRFTWATAEEAGLFSLDSCFDFLPKDQLPLGVHGVVGWPSLGPKIWGVQDE